MSRPQAITFDIGHTLLEAIDSLSAYREAALKFGASDYETDELWSSLTAAMKHAASLRSDNKDNDQIQHDHWRVVVSHIAEHFEPFSNIDVDAWLTALWKHYGSPAAWRPYPETHAVIKALQQEGVRLAAISNWDSRLPSILEAHGLGNCFDEVAVSASVGVRKPDAEIFRYAARQWDFDPQHIWHVGDNLEDDVVGARAVDFVPILVNRWTNQPKNSTTIATLTELLS